MTFVPKMQSRIEGISVLGELKWRAWHGVIADVWSVECAAHARGEYVSPDPRLVVILDRIGAGGIHVMTSANQVARDRGSLSHPICYVPAGLPLWSEVEDMQRLQHLDIHFDMATLRARFGRNLEEQHVEQPRLMFSDDRIMGLARLIATECIRQEQDNDLYCDSLIAALVMALWPVAPKAKRKRGELTPGQLRRVVDFIEENCLRNIRLEEISNLIGLSQEQVGRAFRASTGMPLHQWHTKARVERLKGLLERQDLTLTQTAQITGFSDQAHMTRVFRRVVGTTPAAWQRLRLL